jgi:MFS family permease
MPALTYKDLLTGNRPFRRLWVGQVISELGSWFNFIAGLGLVRAISHASPEVTAILLIVRTAPFAMLAPIAGALVDRWPRRTVMIASDLARVVCALGFLLVHRPEDLWIAYVSSILLSLLTAFFEAAKNASLPNIVGDDGLLAGNALMFSSRFILMSLGAALGGWASYFFGYEIAFVINAVSFAASAVSVWLIPSEATRSRPTEGDQTRAIKPRKGIRLHRDLAEGWGYIIRHSMVAMILLTNIIWALGGGATNLLSDRIGGVVFAGTGLMHGDAAVAGLYFASGLGLFIGMMMARRVGSYIELHGATTPFIGWTILLHGIIFAAGGLMPSLWLIALMYLLSRLLLGVEFAVQETLLARLVPDQLRGRVQTSDRAAEIAIMSLSTALTGVALNYASPRTLMIVCGLVAGSPGLIWLVGHAFGRMRLPAQAYGRSTPVADAPVVE